MHINKRQTSSHYEEIVATFLTNKGYRVLGRNFRCHQGEVDLVCHHDRYLAFAEVKCRSKPFMGNPAEAADARKQGCIWWIAVFYLYNHRMNGDVPCRFGMVRILDSDIGLIQNAF